MEYKMTNSSDRLDRIETILERITLKQEAAERETKAIRSLVESNSLAIEETRKLTESNSRAILAMIDQRTTDRLRIERLEQLTESVAKVQQGMSRLLASIDEDRPTILRKLNTIENKIDRLIEDK